MDLEKVPPHTRAGLLAMNNDRPLNGVDRKELAESCIQRYIDGEDMLSLAHEHGISRCRLYQVLAEHAETEWKSAQAASALVAYEEAEKALEQAQDGVALGRAREQLRSQQWKLERVLRRIYGQDSPQVQVNINLGNVGERIADLERELLSQRTVEAKYSPTVTNSTQVIDPE